MAEIANWIGMGVEGRERVRTDLTARLVKLSRAGYETEPTPQSIGSLSAGLRQVAHAMAHPISRGPAMDPVQLRPIGIVRSPRKTADDDYWGDIISEIHLDPAQFSPDALLGLDQFSHAEIIFFMHQVSPASVQSGARHPRERKDWPLTGIFAQRGKARPNRLGLSRCTVLKLEGMVLTVRALDAIDQSPVLDIKPFMAEFAPLGPTHQPAWASELMVDYYRGGKAS